MSKKVHVKNSLVEERENQCYVQEGVLVLQQFPELSQEQ